MEFVFLVGIAFTLLLVFTKVAKTQSTSIDEQLEYNDLKEIGTYIQNELFLASSTNNDYERTFTIPKHIGTDIEYGITVDQRTLILNTTTNEIVLNIPNITGSIIKGNNTIRKDADGITITPG